MLNDSPFSLEDYLRFFLDALPKDILEEAERKAEEKDVLRRMLRLLEDVAELATEVALLPSGGPEVREEAYSRLHQHIEHLVEDSVRLFEAGSFASAMFLAIVAIEELGKASVAKVQAMLGVPVNAKITGRAKRRSLRSHRDKHFLAAAAGAVINSRLDRLLGTQRVLRFVESAEAGQLEPIRQSALYYEMTGNGQHLPYDTVSRETALDYLVIALELFAEIVPPGGKEWEQALSWVDEVENRLGFKGTDEISDA